MIAVFRISILVLLLLCTASASSPATGRAVHLLYRGIQPGAIPAVATDQQGQPFKVTGLSGIVYAGGSRFWAEEDNSNKIVRFDVTFNPDCSIRDFRITGGLSVAEHHDYEGITLLNPRTVLLSEEDTPGIHAFDLATGKRRLDVKIPDVYLHGNTVANQGFESLTRSPNGQSLWAANERALVCDGNTKLIGEPFGSTTRCRLQHFTIKDGIPVADHQFVYRTSGVHDLGGYIGLSDLVALPDGRLLALDRSAAEGITGKKSIRTRIFLVDPRGATDVSGLDYAKGLDDKPIREVSKTLLYDGFIFDDNGENLEGLCLGPQVEKNRWIVLGVVDDTDAIGVSKTRLVAFELWMGT